MRITMLKATNMDMTDAIRAHVENRVESLSKLCEEFDPADEMRVEVGKSSKHHAKGPYFFAEMQLAVPRTTLRAMVEAEDLYEAVDTARDQIRRQLTDYKEKLDDKSHRGARPDKE